MSNRHLPRYISSRPTSLPRDHSRTCQSKGPPDPQEAAQEVLSVINSTGSDLTDMDRVRQVTISLLRANECLSRMVAEAEIKMTMNTSTSESGLTKVPEDR
ncbi:unnamed protein product [Protopolystoma xenopodis]|uniref:GAT domain-containing protein n=1 Tax=Protopolystoma xenopodis TaxID=117903 RepID=A0A448X3K0_9PLAT|nr:unnamed protein product [Protopolystoma xenopodis]